MFFEMKKTGAKYLCSNFDWEKLWFFHKFLFLVFYTLCLDALWNGQFFDSLLVREILVIEPHQLTPKSKEWDQAWTELARNVIKALETDYVVSQG